MTPLILMYFFGADMVIVVCLLLLLFVVCRVLCCVVWFPVVQHVQYDASGVFTRAATRRLHRQSTAKKDREETTKDHKDRARPWVRVRERWVLYWVLHLPKLYSSRSRYQEYLHVQYGR